MDRFHRLMAGLIEVGAPERVGGKSWALATALLFKAAQLNFPPTLQISNSELCRLSGLTPNELYPARNRLIQFHVNGIHPFYYRSLGSRRKPGLYAINYPLLMFQYELAAEVEREWITSRNRPDFQSSDYFENQTNRYSENHCCENQIDRYSSRCSSHCSNREVKPGVADRPNAENAEQSYEDREEDEEEDLLLSKASDVVPDYSMVERYLCQATDPPKAMLSAKESQELLRLAKEGVPAEFCIEAINRALEEMRAKDEVIYNPQMYLIRCIRNAWREHLRERRGGERDAEREYLERKYEGISL